MRATGPAIVALAFVVGCAGQRAGGIAGGRNEGELTGEMAGRYVAALPGVAATLERGEPSRGVMSLDEAIDEALLEPSAGLRRAVRKGGYDDVAAFTESHRPVWEAYHYIAVWQSHEAVKRGIEEGKVREGEGGVTTVEELEQAYGQGEKFAERVSGRVKADARELAPFFGTLREQARAFEEARRGG